MCHLKSSQTNRLRHQIVSNTLYTCTIKSHVKRTENNVLNKTAFESKAVHPCVHLVMLVRP